MSNTNAVPVITGTTDVYLILGDPVEQVRAPETFNPLFAAFGSDAVLLPVLVTPADLSAFVKSVFLAKNIKGLWVTMPHKEAIVGALDSCSELAQIAGAVNAVRRNEQGQLEALKSKTIADTRSVVEERGLRMPAGGIPAG